MKINYRILYKRNSGKNFYVSNYDYAKVGDGYVLGSFKFTNNILEAKRIPPKMNHIKLLDDSVRIDPVFIIY